MAGSYNHIVDENGAFARESHHVETGGDVIEALEECYGMIWYLAGGNAAKVEEARRNYKKGLEMAPQREKREE